jgi:hypothetical protein
MRVAAENSVVHLMDTTVVDETFWPSLKVTSTVTTLAAMSSVVLKEHPPLAPPTCARLSNESVTTVTPRDSPNDASMLPNATVMALSFPVSMPGDSAHRAVPAPSPPTPLVTVMRPSLESATPIGGRVTVVYLLMPWVHVATMEGPDAVATGLSHLTDALTAATPSVNWRSSVAEPEQVQRVDGQFCGS